MTSKKTAGRGVANSRGEVAASRFADIPRPDNQEARPPLGSAILNSEEARALLRMGKSAFWEAVSRGDVPSYKLGGRKRYYPRAGIERLISAAAERADKSRAS